MKRIRRIWLFGTVIVSLAAGTNSPAQQSVTPTTATDGELAEVTVTAQRREQNLQDVGISIAAISGETLRSMSISSSVDIARLTPGVSISSSYGGQDSQFSIRGVTQNDFADTVEGPVAVYVDDGYVPTLSGQNFGLFDIQRVEVLKGPQGTLFGRNATGGLVQFIVNKPTADTDGFVTATYGAYNQTKLEAAIGGSLADKLEGRISLYWDRFDPILTNKYPAGEEGVPPSELSPCCQNTWNDETLGLRAQLLFEPTDNLSIRLVSAATGQDLSSAPYNSIATIAQVNAQGNVIAGYYASSSETRTAIGPNGTNYAAFSGAPPSRLPGANWFGFVAPSAQSLQISSDYARSDAYPVRNYNEALHVDYKVGDITITAITDYKHLEHEFGLDTEVSPLSLVDVAQYGKTQSITQELRANGGDKQFNWTAGLYYLNIDTDAHEGFMAPPGSVYSGIFDASTTGVALANVDALRTKSYSAFGQVEYEFAPRWTFIVGGRLIREQQDFAFVSNAYESSDFYHIVDLGPALFPLQPAFADARANTLWAGKTQLEFRPSSDLLAYAGVNRGVKGGSFNAKLPDGTPPLAASEIPYQPEVLVSYEAGLKFTFPDGRSTLDLAAFYYDYHNYQAFTFENVSGVVQNRDARTRGVEASFRTTPVTGLTLEAGLSLLDAKVLDVQIAPGIFNDTRPTFTPKGQASARIGYRIPADVVGGSVTASADGSYQSSVYENIRNFDDQVADGYFLANAQLVWSSAGDKYTLTAAVANIADKRYVTTGYDLSTLCGCSEISYGRPRWWSVSGGYRF